MVKKCNQSFWNLDVTQMGPGDTGRKGRNSEKSDIAAVFHHITRRFNIQPIPALHQLCHMQQLRKKSEKWRLGRSKFKMAAS
jgi:hypothetical protein